MAVKYSLWRIWPLLIWHLSLFIRRGEHEGSRIYIHFLFASLTESLMWRFGCRWRTCNVCRAIGPMSMSLWPSTFVDAAWSPSRIAWMRGVATLSTSSTLTKPFWSSCCRSRVAFLASPSTPLLLSSLILLTLHIRSLCTIISTSAVKSWKAMANKGLQKDPRNR